MEITKIIKVDCSKFCYNKKKNNFNDYFKELKINGNDRGWKKLFFFVFVLVNLYINLVINLLLLSAYCQELLVMNC